MLGSGLGGIGRNSSTMRCFSMNTLLALPCTANTWTARRLWPSRSLQTWPLQVVLFSSRTKRDHTPLWLLAKGCISSDRSMYRIYHEILAKRQRTKPCTWPWTPLVAYSGPQKTLVKSFCLISSKSASMGVLWSPCIIWNGLPYKTVDILKESNCYSSF